MRMNAHTGEREAIHHGAGLTGGKSGGTRESEDAASLGDSDIIITHARGFFFFWTIEGSIVFVNS